MEFADGIALYPRPDVVPGVPLVLYGSQYPDAALGGWSVDSFIFARTG
jgi:hypothetical protein